jgi:hypothetical protein
LDQLRKSFVNPCRSKLHQLIVAPFGKGRPAQGDDRAIRRPIFEPASLVFRIRAHGVSQPEHQKEWLR